MKGWIKVVEEVVCLGCSATDILKAGEETQCQEVED